MRNTFMAACLFLALVSKVSEGTMVDDFVSGSIQIVRENGDDTLVEISQPELEILGGTRKFFISHLTRSDTRFDAEVDVDRGVFDVATSHATQVFQLTYGAVENPLHVDFSTLEKNAIAIDFRSYSSRRELLDIGVSLEGTDLNGELFSPIRMYSTVATSEFEASLEPFTLLFPVSSFSPVSESVDLTNILGITLGFNVHEGDSFELDHIRIVPEPTEKCSPMATLLLIIFMRRLKGIGCEKRHVMRRKMECV